MSFLTTTRAALTATVRPRALLTITPTPTTRAFFSTTLQRPKTAAETARDALKTVDRAVSEKLVDGIEVGETAAAKAKQVAGMSAAEAKGKAEEMKGAAKGKVEEVKGKAKGVAAEAEGKAKAKGL